jgi:hypothetical protein
MVQARLIDLCVAEDEPRHEVERALLRRLEEGVGRPGDFVHLIVPESDLAVQLFLREIGYRATRLLQCHYGSEDGYLMVAAPFGRARRPGPAGAFKGLGGHGTVSASLLGGVLAVFNAALFLMPGGGFSGLFAVVAALAFALVETLLLLALIESWVNRPGSHRAQGGAGQDPARADQSAGENRKVESQGK